MKFKATKAEIMNSRFQVVDTKIIDGKTEKQCKAQAGPGYVLSKIPTRYKVKTYLLFLYFSKEDGHFEKYELGAIDELKRTTGDDIRQIGINKGIVYVVNLKQVFNYLDINFTIVSKLTGKDNRIYSAKTNTGLEFRDLLCKIPMFPHQIAESLKVTDSFEAVRTLLQEMTETGLTKITIASDGLIDYKNRIGGESVFLKYFKGLAYEEDSYIRKSYRGGFLACNPSKTGHGYSFDINSSFPYVMVTELIPYGKPIKYTGKYKENQGYPLYIQRIIVDCSVKEGYLPCITSDEKQYLRDTLLPVEITLTAPDLKLLETYYDIHYIKYLDGYMFKGAYGFFDDFVNFHYTTKKAGANQLDVVKSKLLLNTLYGKMGAHPVHIQQGKATVGKIGRVDVSSFISAYARFNIVTICQQAQKHGIFRYCDTDSVHVEAESIPDFIKPYLDKKKLGAFKIEREFSEAIFIAPKCYTEKLIGINQWKLTASGVAEEVAKSVVTFDNFQQSIEKGMEIQNRFYKVNKDGIMEQHEVKFTLGGINQ